MLLRRTKLSGIRNSQHQSIQLVYIKMVVKYPQPSHEIIIPREQHHQAAEWCTETFGPRWEAIGNRSGTWTCFWAGWGNYRFVFVKEEDAIICALRYL